MLTNGSCRMYCGKNGNLGNDSFDYYAVEQLTIKHFVANDLKDAARIAFNTGVQYEFPQANCYRFLPELLKKGKIKITDFNKAVAQVLELKFNLGLFENPYVDADAAVKVTKIPNPKLALKAAQSQLSS